jgi:hypothetical protein
MAEPASIQLTLNQPQDFRPVPDGTGHYVAALQNLSGERDALSECGADTWGHLTPLIHIVGPKRAEKEPFKRDRVAGWVKNVADCMGDHPFFLTTLRLDPSHATAVASGTEPVLAVIAACARKRGLQFVPVLRLADAATTRVQVADIAACDGRGAALRVPLLGTVGADGRPRETLVKEAIDAVHLTPEAADLLLDLGYLPDDVDVSVDLLASSIDELVAVGHWRSVVLLGTSMPRSLGGGVVGEGTVGRLPRREWELWCGLRASSVSRLPTFGDYAVQHPEPPEEDEQTGPGMRANVRYTLEDVTLIPRGVGPFTQEGIEGYRPLCRQVVADPGFRGAGYTWGDRVIAECAGNTGPSGTQHLWRGAGTSHHFRHVVDQLAGLT